jgi:Arc/MetJ-type ribon-helix-helix transcriptional regulator
MDEEQYPVIKNIRNALKADDRISESQVQEYKRRLNRSDFLKVHVELLQQYHRQKIQAQRVCSEKEDEIKHLYMNLKILRHEIKQIKETIISENGEKSFEYQVYEQYFKNLGDQAESSKRPVVHK